MFKSPYFRGLPHNIFWNYSCTVFISEHISETICGICFIPIQKFTSLSDNTHMWSMIHNHQFFYYEKYKFTYLIKQWELRFLLLAGTQFDELWTMFEFLSPLWDVRQNKYLKGYPSSGPLLEKWWLIPLKVCIKII